VVPYIVSADLVITAAGAPLGAVFGNLLGGIISEYASWKWVFVVIALAALAISAAAFFVIPVPKQALEDENPAGRASIDWLGAVLITGGLLALLFALTEGNVVGWSTPWIAVLIVISVVLVGLFALWQRHLEKTGKLAPIMKVSVFRNPQFSAAMAIMALFFSSFNGFLVYATYFYQDYQGNSPLQTTLRFMPTGITGFITAAVVSQLLAKVPTYLMLVVGNICICISTLLFAAPIPPDTIYWAWSFPAMILSVFGADTAWPCLFLFTSHSLPQADQALGGALVNAMAQVGRAVGLAVATAIQTAVMARERGVSVEDAGSVERGDLPSLLGMRAAEWWNFSLGIAALAVVLIAFRGSGIIGKVPVVRAETPAQTASGRDEEEGKGFGQCKAVHQTTVPEGGR
jgi:predicted MFS family arabinose efflux permease